jgi:hypothetical protein
MRVPSASAVELLASAPDIRRRIATAALEAVSARSWNRSLGQLADGYRRALNTSAVAAARRAA